MVEDRTDAKVQDIKLEADQELRFHVPESEGEEVVLELLVGSAEIFGTELVSKVKYRFRDGLHLAVFSWRGCILQLTGRPERVHVARETPMIMYLNTHAVLEEMRRKLDSETDVGPVVMVCGPRDVGKSTLCRMLLNYAVRVGRRPVYVDMDVGQGSIGLPSCVGAMQIDRTANIEEGFIESSPIVYHFGHNTPGHNVDLYMKIGARLAKTVRERVQSNKKARTSGVIINTCGWTKQDGYKIITDLAQNFEVDAIIVLDDERLYNELTRDMPPFVKVVFQPKSGGVTQRSQFYRSYMRDKRIHEYFYGKNGALEPHTLSLDFDQVRMYKIPPNRIGLEPITPGKDPMVNHLVSVSFARENNEEAITTNIRGFLCVLEVDEKEEKVVVLSPNATIPDGILLLSEIECNPGGDA